MVLGNSSKFTEGFTSFTADDEMMIANLKQALNYSKEHVAIPDPSINITTTTSPATTKANTSMMNSNTTTREQRGNSRAGNLPTNITSVSGEEPSTTSPNATTTTTANMTGRMTGTISTRPETTRPQTTMSITTTTSPAIPTPTPTPTPTTTRNANTMASTTTTRPAGGASASVSSFKNIPRVRNNGDEDEDDSDDEDAVLEEEDRTNQFEEAAKRRSETRRQHDKVREIEGFRGSVEIESRQMRNILLALLLSCIGYLVVYSMGTNLLPLDEISPQIKKFKRLIYAGLFFGITYICLEVF